MITNLRMELFQALVMVVVTLVPRITAEGELVAGSTLRLVCTVAGARPAATLRWYNATPATAPRALASSTQLASLQGDGSYVSLSRLEVELGAWHHGHTLYCLADTDTGSQAHTAAAYY